jgi:hypothetical protein
MGVEPLNYMRVGGRPAAALYMLHQYQKDLAPLYNST